MLYLLSSDYSPRYKQDILRCLSAPIGSVIQFRYDKVHIAKDVLEKLTRDSEHFPKDGMVCSVASKGVGILPIVPVRSVQVQRPRLHGQTLSVTLTIGQVVYHASPDQFTRDLDPLSKHQIPRVAEEGQSPQGCYFFEANVPQNTQIDASVATWEQTVATLREQHAYKGEPFFWVTIGVEPAEEPLDTLQLHSWPQKVAPRSAYNLLVYHFQPRGGPKPDSKMEVALGNLLFSTAPPDTAIDSRYDLKSWSFTTKENPLRSRTTWLRIRTADQWDLDLILSVTASQWKTVFSGTLVAVPAIFALIPQNLCLRTKLLLALGGVAAGILSSVVAASRMDRP